MNCGMPACKQTKLLRSPALACSRSTGWRRVRHRILGAGQFCSAAAAGLHCSVVSLPTRLKMCWFKQPLPAAAGAITAYAIHPVPAATLAFRTAMLLQPDKPCATHPPNRLPPLPAQVNPAAGSQWVGQVEALHEFWASTCSLGMQVRGRSL